MEFLGEKNQDIDGMRLVCAAWGSHCKNLCIHDEVDVCSCVLREHSRACVRGRVQVRVNGLLYASVSESTGQHSGSDLLRTSQYHAT